MTFYTLFDWRAIYLPLIQETICEYDLEIQPGTIRHGQNGQFYSEASSHGIGIAWVWIS